jgi:hypothetical protein
VNPNPRSVRKFIFDQFYETASPPVLEEIMERFSVPRVEAFALLKAVEADHHILLVPGTQRILMANPYSAVTTPFRVYADGKRYFANCAWDTVSMHVMLDMGADIESYCHHCAEHLRISLDHGKLLSSSTPEPTIFLSVPVSKWYDNLINTCSNNMVYFASPSHMDDWLAKNPALKGEALSVDKMAEVCTPLSKGRMDLDYQRPPKERLEAYWESIGMKSDFWKF